VFDIRYGLRKWRSARFQWLLLIFSLGVFSVLLSLVLQLGAKLLVDRPEYVSSEAPFVTVGRKNHSGEFTPIRGVELSYLAEQVVVDDVGRLTIEQRDVIMGGRQYPDVTLAYYSANLPDLLGLPGEWAEADNNQKVYLSQSFKQQYFGEMADTSSLTLDIVGADGKYNVTGVLPDSLNRWGQKRPEIWVPMTELAHIMPLRLSAEEKKDPEKVAENLSTTRAVLQGLPQYFGFVKLNTPQSVAEVQQVVESMDPSFGEHAATMKEAPHELWVVSGIEMDPRGYTNLVRQWWMLLILTLVYGAICCSNLIFVATSQLAERQQEMAIRIATGAGNWRLLGQVITEQIPLLILALMLGALGYVWLLPKINALPLFQQYLGTQGMGFNPGLWLTGALLLGLFIIFCAVLPLISLLRRGYFSRGKGQSASVGHKWLHRSNTLAQLGLALFAVSLAATMMLFQWQQAQQQDINRQLKEIRLFSDYPMHYGEAVKDGRVGRFSERQVGVSANYFVTPKTGSPDIIPLDGSEQTEYPIRQMDVTPGYFQLLGVNVLAGDANLPRDGAVLNRSAAEMLLQGDKKDHAALLGSQFEIKSFVSDRVHIVAVIDDLPHFGRRDSDVPIVYTHFANIPQIARRAITLTYQPQLHDQLMDFVDRWSMQELGPVEITERPTIAKQLDELNRLPEMMFRFALVISVLILMMVLANLYFQARVYIQLNTSRYGIMMAVGASPLMIFFNNANRLFLLCLVSIPLALAILVWALPVLTGYLGISIFSAPVFAFCLLVLVLLVQLVSVWPVRQLLKKPVNQLIAHQD